MNDKIRDIIDACLSYLPDGDQGTFRELAAHAVSLGYNPKWVKRRVNGEAVNSTSLAFTSSRVKRTLIKITPGGSPFDKGRPCLALSFFATPVYSALFRQGIQRVIEEFGGRYTGCYGCGGCEGEPLGYTFIYPDGKKIFRCGGELIELPPISADNINEIKQLMSTQDRLFQRLAVT
jgi:glycerate kinase